MPACWIPSSGAAAPSLWLRASRDSRVSPGDPLAIEAVSPEGAFLLVVSSMRTITVHTPRLVRAWNAKRCCRDRGGSIWLLLAAGGVRAVVGLGVRTRTARA